jgi:uncharacterized membrane protein
VLYPIEPRQKDHTHKREGNMRQYIRLASAILGLILLLYLLLGLSGLVPMVDFKFLGMNLLHFIGQGAIVCFLIAAWGYWEI